MNFLFRTMSYFVSVYIQQQKQIQRFHAKQIAIKLLECTCNTSRIIGNALEYIPALTV